MNVRKSASGAANGALRTPPPADAERPVTRVTDDLVMIYAILSPVRRLIYLRVLLAVLLIGALAAPAFACLGDMPGQHQSCEAMDCCQHSHHVPARSMKTCDCRDDATSQQALASGHHVQFVVLATVAVIPPATAHRSDASVSVADASPPGPASSSVLRL